MFQNYKNHLVMLWLVLKTLTLETGPLGSGGHHPTLFCARNPNPGSKRAKTDQKDQTNQDFQNNNEHFFKSVFVFFEPGFGVLAQKKRRMVSPGPQGTSFQG